MTAAIILAAGVSSRLGFPKQTLLYKGKTLLEWAVEAAQKSTCSPVMVMLGAHAEEIVSFVHTDIIFNANWREGVASSIRMSIEHIGKMEAVEQVIFTLCDQPFVNRALLDSMIYKQQQTGKPIVACAYKDTVGVPVLFTRSLFAELLDLTGKDGAKKVIHKHLDDVAIIPFEKGGIDIDTLEDYERLISD